jgi:hypothetical protein
MPLKDESGKILKHGDNVRCFVKKDAFLPWYENAEYEDVGVVYKCEYSPSGFRVILERSKMSVRTDSPKYIVYRRIDDKVKEKLDA